jgi:hypothetical protein
MTIPKVESGHPKFPWSPAVIVLASQLMPPSRMVLRERPDARLMHGNPAIWQSGALPFPDRAIPQF